MLVSGSAVVANSTDLGTHYGDLGAHCGERNSGLSSVRDKPLRRFASASAFSWFLGRCNFLFCVLVSPGGHHLGIVYFGSVVALLKQASWSLAACFGLIVNNGFPARSFSKIGLFMTITCEPMNLELMTFPGVWFDNF
jgi:hypothetical protein